VGSRGGGGLPEVLHCVLRGGGGVTRAAEPSPPTITKKEFHQAQTPIFPHDVLFRTRGDVSPGKYMSPLSI
jgi:hypothetical protein